MTPTFADLAKAQYILLTTFTKDGRPKPVPVWAALDKDRGDRLLVITEGKSWKVKRIRNTPPGDDRQERLAGQAQER